MHDDADELITYKIAMTDEAYLAYAAIPSERIFDRVDHDIELLETSPFLGHVYDPAYKAKEPPTTCRVLFCEHYGIYYTVDDEAHEVLVLAIEDQRRDPMNRFSSFVYAVESFD